MPNHSNQSTIYLFTAKTLNSRGQISANLTGCWCIRDDSNGSNYVIMAFRLTSQTTVGPRSTS